MAVRQQEQTVRGDDDDDKEEGGEGEGEGGQSSRLLEYDSNDDDDEYHLSQPGLLMRLEMDDSSCSRDACRTTAINARTSCR